MYWWWWSRLGSAASAYTLFHIFDFIFASPYAVFDALQDSMKRFRYACLKPFIDRFWNRCRLLGSLITEEGECRTEFRTRLNRGQAIGASLQKIWKSHSTPISTKIWLSASVVCSCVRLWKLDTQKEWRKTSWGLWDERTEKDSACFVDNKENKWVGSQQSWSKEGTVRHCQSKEAMVTLWGNKEIAWRKK